MAITYGIDKTDNTTFTTAYKGYFISALYAVGDNLNKRQFTQLEFQLARPLRAGEGIKIEYRTDLTSSFTTIGTYTFTSLGAVLSHNTTADIISCEFIQIKLSPTGSGTTPEVRTITLK